MVGKGRIFLLLLMVLLIPTGCRIFPAEFNLGPIYRHRLDPAGEMVSMDLLWPVFHYEQLSTGGWEFRIRPLYRRVSQPATEEHQFLWPLGRSLSTPTEDSLRLFPILSWRDHLNENGKRDVDWTFLTPLFWGGHSDEGEDYFACMPLYGRIPQFMSYEEAGWFLFPLYTWSEKRGNHTRSVLFPFFSMGWGDEEDDSWYYRAFPFYSQSEKPGMWWNRTVAWPILSWGEENLAGKDPREYWFLFPFYGQTTSASGDYESWTALWPFFRHVQKNADSTRWQGPWPLFTYTNETGPGETYLRQWWLTPLYQATDTEKQWSRVVLYPLIWMNEFREPHMESTNTTFFPLYWRNEYEIKGEKKETSTRLFPLISTRHNSKGLHQVHFPDPYPWRLSSGEGYREFYDFLWNIYSRRRQAGRVGITTPANILCHDVVDGVSTWSVPFLFHTEKAKNGKVTLRLLQIFPIHWGGNESPRDKGDSAKEIGNK